MSNPDCSPSIIPGLCQSHDRPLIRCDAPPAPSAAARDEHEEDAIRAAQIRAAAPALGAALVERVARAVYEVGKGREWSDLTPMEQDYWREVARTALREVEPILTWDAEKISALIDERNAAQAEVRRLTQEKAEITRLWENARRREDETHEAYGMLEQEVRRLTEARGPELTDDERRWIKDCETHRLAVVQNLVAVIWRLTGPKEA